LQNDHPQRNGAEKSDSLNQVNDASLELGIPDTSVLVITLNRRYRVAGAGIRITGIAKP